MASIGILALLFNWSSALGIGIQSTTSPTLANNLLLRKLEYFENPEQPVPTIQQVESQNSQLVQFLQDLAKTTSVPVRKEMTHIVLNNRVNIDEPTRPPPNRPFFAGQTGGNFRPQLVSTATVVDRFQENPTISQSETTTKRTVYRPQNSNIRPQASKPIVITTTRVPITDRINDLPIKPPPRPSFAGQTGGNFKPQLIPSGTPWPSKPGGSNTFVTSSNTPQIVDRFEDTSTWRPSQGFLWNGKPVTSTKFPPLIRPSNRPSKPQPTKPKPVKPNVTSNPSIVDRFEGNTPSVIYTEVITIPTRPSPNRPFFAGQTGGNYKPQLIPPGKPWPARPEDYSTFSATSVNIQFTKSPILAQSELKPEPAKPVEPSVVETEFGDRFKETTTSSPNQGDISKPPFMCVLGDKQKPSVTTKDPNVSDRFQDATTSISTPIKPSSNRPSFAGETGGNLQLQIIPPGNPLPSKPEDEIPNGTPTNTPVDNRFEENSTMSYKESETTGSSDPTRPPPNRPPFAGDTGGNFKPQIIPPGTPWPAKPDDKTTKSPPVDKETPPATTPLSLLLDGSTEKKISILDGTLFTSKPRVNKKS